MSSFLRIALHISESPQKLIAKTGRGCDDLDIEIRSFGRLINGIP